MHSCVHIIRSKAVSYKLTKNPSIGDSTTVQRGAMPITKPTIVGEILCFRDCRGGEDRYISPNVE